MLVAALIQASSPPAAALHWAALSQARRATPSPYRRSLRSLGRCASV